MTSYQSYQVFRKNGDTYNEYGEVESTYMPLHNSIQVKVVVKSIAEVKEGIVCHYPVYHGHTECRSLCPGDRLEGNGHSFIISYINDAPRLAVLYLEKQA